MQRLDRFLSEAGVASRRELRTIIRAGRVRVNDVPASAPEQKIDETSDRVTLDGEAVGPRGPVVLLLHKPTGYVTSTDDPRDRTVMELLPPQYRGLAPVGRLDKDTSGLLLLTDDGQLAHRLTSPRHAVWKIYDAVHEGEVCRPAYLRPLGPGRSLVAVCEGKYHQVRRMLASRGMPVTALRRIAEGGLELGALPIGMTRELTCGEIRLLETVDFDEAYLEKLVQKIRNML